MKKCLAVFLILAVGLLGGCGKTSGYVWELVETEINEQEWQAQLAQQNERDGYYKREAEVSEGSIVWNDTYIGETSGNFPYTIQGNSTTVEATWSEPPQTVSGPEFEVSLRITMEVVDRHPQHPLPTGCTISAEIPISDEQDGTLIHSYFSDDEGESSFQPSPENEFAPVDVIAYGFMEDGQTVGERRVIEIRAGPGKPLMSYIYEWKEQ